MNQKHRSALFFLAFLTFGAAGCGNSNEPVKEDPAALAKRVESAKGLRSYFDKSGGNYAALSAEDKAAVDKLTGGETNSQTAFSRMTR